MTDVQTASRRSARLIQREDREWMPALHLALGLGPPPTADASNSGVSRFLKTARARGLATDCLSGTFQDAMLVNAVLGVRSPGRVAMVVAPWEVRGPQAIEELGLSLKLIVPTLLSRGAQLVEILTPPDMHAIGDLLPTLGLQHLTRLVYLRRPVSTLSKPVVSNAPSTTELNWIRFSSEASRLFEQTVQATYAQTLDCPELSGTRTMPDVLAGHQAAAEFDPANWFVAMRGTEPAGVLLLGSLPEQAAMEIVYMGVTQPARGQGVADALLARAVRTSAEQSAKHLALAVDRRNAPARRVYARWGFVETGTRDAWVAWKRFLDAKKPARASVPARNL